MRPPPLLRLRRRLSSSSAAVSAAVLRRDLSLLLSRPSLDRSLCCTTLSRLSPTLLDSLLADIRLCIQPKPALHFFSFAVDHLRFPFSPFSYSILLHSLFSSPATAAAARLLLLRLLDQSPTLSHDLINALADTSPSPINSPALDALIHLCCTQLKSPADRQVSAVTTFRALAKRGCCPSLKTCNILITTLCKLRQCTDALMVLDRKSVV